MSVCLPSKEKKLSEPENKEPRDKEEDETHVGGSSRDLFAKIKNKTEPGSNKSAKIFFWAPVYAHSLLWIVISTCCVFLYFAGIKSPSKLALEAIHKFLFRISNCDVSFFPFLYQFVCSLSILFSSVVRLRFI